MLALTDLIPLGKRVQLLSKSFTFNGPKLLAVQTGWWSVNMKSWEEAGWRSPHVEAQREIDPELLNFCQQQFPDEDQMETIITLAHRRPVPSHCSGSASEVNRRLCRGSYYRGTAKNKIYTKIASQTEELFLSVLAATYQPLSLCTQHCLLVAHRLLPTPRQQR